MVGLLFFLLEKGETHPIGYVSLVDSVSSAAPNGLQLLDASEFFMDFSLTPSKTHTLW